MTRIGRFPCLSIVESLTRASKSARLSCIFLSYAQVSQKGAVTDLRGHLDEADLIEWEVFCDFFSFEHLH